MSISSLQSSVERAHADISSLTGKLSELSRKLADKSGRIADAHAAAVRASSLSALQSKQREVVSLQKDLAGIEKDKANFEKQVGDKKRDLHKYEAELAKERDRESQKAFDTQKRRQRELSEADNRRQRDLEGYKRDLAEVLSPRKSVPDGGLDEADSGIIAPKGAPKKFDLFISHAWEDKAEFVRPLAAALATLGLEIWYDEATLKLGDSLRQSIDKGLLNSRYGVVVLSTAFFAKNWTQYELNGLVTKEMAGEKVVLPIWHKVSKDEVAGYSPTLADKVALNSSLYGVMEIAEQLRDFVRS